MAVEFVEVQMFTSFMNKNPYHLFCKQLQLSTIFFICMVFHKIMSSYFHCL